MEKLEKKDKKEQKRRKETETKVRGECGGRNSGGRENKPDTHRSKTKRGPAISLLRIMHLSRPPPPPPPSRAKFSIQNSLKNSKLALFTATIDSLIDWIHWIH